MATALEWRAEPHMPREQLGCISSLAGAGRHCNNRLIPAGIKGFPPQHTSKGDSGGNRSDLCESSASGIGGNCNPIGLLRVESGRMGPILLSFRREADAS